MDRVHKFRAASFRRNRADRYDSNLVLGCVHVCSYFYVPPVDPAERLPVVDLRNLAVIICGEGLAIVTKLAQDAGRLLRQLMCARTVILG